MMAVGLGGDGTSPAAFLKVNLSAGWYKKEGFFFF